MIKYIVFLIISLNFTLSYSQLSDTSCIKSKYFIIQPSEKNRPLFEFNTNYTDSNFIRIVLSLIFKNQIKIHDEKAWNSDYPPKIEFSNDIKNELNVFTKNYWLYIHKSAKKPFNTIYGDDSVFVQNDGTIIGVYPPDEIFPCQLTDFSEIRIKEDRIFNSEQKQYLFVPTAIGFYFSKFDGYFWIDLFELESLLKDKEKYSWYNLIYNKKYVGFQYYQLACYDKRTHY